MKISTQDLPLIIVRESEKPDLYNALMGDEKNIRKMLLGTTEKVLDVMLRNNLTLVPERRAVWCNYIFVRCAENDPLFRINVKEKVGESFPDDPLFEKGCEIHCLDKSHRTEINPDLICSHEDRNPINKTWGGSTKFTIRLISISGHCTVIICIIAPSGLKEWEDFGLAIGVHYDLGIISRDDLQVKEMLHRADESVRNDPEFRPPGMSITAYVMNLFNVIDIMKR